MPLDTSDTFAAGENPTKAKFDRAWRNNLVWLKGAPPSYTASTISAAAADNSYNDSASGFPSWAVQAGDYLLATGFSNGANNGTATIVSATTSKVVVSGLTLVNEAAGGARQLEFQQEYTSRGVMLKAPEFIHNARDDIGTLTDTELRHVYTGAPGSTQYRFLTDTLAVALANGLTGKLMGSVEDPANGEYSLLGFIEWQRTGAATGKLSFDTGYTVDGVLHALHGDFPLTVNSNGTVSINGAASTYALNVDGSVRAAGYFKGGVAVGVWILDTTVTPPTMTFTGSASATKWTAGSYGVLSETETVNPNADKLRGEKWQDQLVVKASGTAVTCPARGGTPTFSFTISDVTTITADADDNSFNDSAGGFPFDVIGPGDEVTMAGFDFDQNNRTFTVVSITASKVVVSGSPLFDEAPVSVDITWTLGYTTVAQSEPVTRAGYYSVEGEMSVPIAAPGNLTNSFFGKCTGSPEGLLGTGYTPFYCSGKATGEVEPLSVCGRANLAVGDVVRLQLSNLTEAPVAVSGSLTARWTATGEDVAVAPFKFGLVLYPFTVI